MKFLRLSVLWLLVVSLSGCLQSRPSDLAVEVMAKRYWQDTLQLESLFPLQDVQMMSAQHEGADLYVAQVRYRVTASMSEADLVARLQQAEQQGSLQALDNPAVVAALESLPLNFRENDPIDLVKTLAFRDGPRGWLLEREILHSN